MMDVKEIWKQIPTYEGLYEVSSHGRVRTMRRIIKYKYKNIIKSQLRESKIMKQKIVNGYNYIVLNKNGKYNTFSVSRLVLTAFKRPRLISEEASHFPDRDKKNNHLSNLRWATHIQNEKDKIFHQTKIEGIKHGMHKLSEKDIIEIRKLKGRFTHKQISKKYNISRQNVGKILNRELWKNI
jgi:hypothetical protein